MMDTPIAVAEEFVERINRGELEGIVELMTEDHRLVDSLGHEVAAIREVGSAWSAYLGMVPDYRIVVEEILCDRDVVVLIGSASGSFVPQGTGESVGGWETPAVWRVVVRDGRVEEWRVYADNEPIRALMRDEKEAQTDA